MASARTEDRARLHRALDRIIDEMEPDLEGEDAEGFTEGTFHPIRGGEGYKPGKVGETRRWKRRRKNS
jgi:hypothetical protein